MLLTVKLIFLPWSTRSERTKEWPRYSAGTLIGRIGEQINNTYNQDKPECQTWHVFFHDPKYFFLQVKYVINYTRSVDFAESISTVGNLRFFEGIYTRMANRLA